MKKGGAIFSITSKKRTQMRNLTEQINENADPKDLIEQRNDLVKFMNDLQIKYNIDNKDFINKKGFGSSFLTGKTSFKEDTDAFDTKLEETFPGRVDGTPLIELETLPSQSAGKRKRKTLKRKRSKKTKNNKKSRKSKRKMTRRRR